MKVIILRGVETIKEKQEVQNIIDNGGNIVKITRYENRKLIYYKEKN